MTEKNPAADHVVERDGYAEVTLTRPREINGTVSSVIRLREPTVEDTERYQESKESEARREVTMIANLCEINPDDLRKFPLRDYNRLQAAFTLFTT